MFLDVSCVGLMTADRPLSYKGSRKVPTNTLRKLRHNSRNDIFEGNQDMLKERDLKLRSHKETNGNDADDYDDSGVMTKENPFTLVFVLVTFTIYLHHHPQLRTLHPVWKSIITVLPHHQMFLSIAIHRKFVNPFRNPSLRDSIPG